MHLKSPKDIFWNYFLFLRPHNGSYVVPYCISYQIRLSHQGSPGGSDSKASAYYVGDPGSILEWRRSPREGNGNPLQYLWMPWMEEPGRLHSMGSQSRTRLSNFTFTFLSIPWTHQVLSFSTGCIHALFSVHSPTCPQTHNCVPQPEPTKSDNFL